MSPVRTRLIAYDPESRYSVTFANVDSSIVSAFVYLRIDFTTSFNFILFLFYLKLSLLNHTSVDMFYLFEMLLFFILYKWFFTTM